jgi:SAM-dependent methyltransferase
MQNHKRRNDLREAYDRYSQERETSTMQEWKIRERSNFLSALQQENKRNFLELGAGPGHDSKYFQDEGFEVTCVDLSPAMVDLCRQKGLTAYVMDMNNLDFPENSFDAVYAMNSLLHLTKQEFFEILHQINSLLRVHGLVYIGMYGGYDHEGILEADTYVPKRFFSFFTDEQVESEVR